MEALYHLLGEIAQKRFVAKNQNFFGANTQGDDGGVFR